MKKAQEPSKRLEENLRYLKLKYFADNYLPNAEEAAKKHIVHTDYLAELVDGETAARSERAVERRIRSARLPFQKSLDQFQWSHPEKINRMQIENLMRLDFIDRHENIVFLGGCGVGKTHLLSALTVRACQMGYNCLFASAIDIINNLTAAKAINSLDKALKRYLSPDVLSIDEVGYLPIDKLGCDLLFQVISKRYECGSVIITCNRAFKQWSNIFNNDSVVTSAILDRVLHHCEVVTIEGQSYRMKDKTAS